MYDFKTFAQMNLDVIFRDFPRMPVPGEEVFAKNFNMQLGGGAMVIPLVLDKLGCSVRLGTFMNNNTVSEVCKTLLGQRGFSAYDSFDGADDNPVVVTSVFSWPEDRGFLAYNRNVNERALSDEAVYDYLKDASVAFAPEGHPEVIRQLSREGVRVVYDTGWHEDLDIRNFTDILPYVEICTPNDREALKMTGKETVEEAIRCLADYTPHPVVTLGSQGCAFWNGNGVEYVPSVEEFRKKAIDSTGAGDNFLAGVIYGMIQKLPLADCLTYGNIFAGYSTTWLGCYGGIITKEMLAELAPRQV